MKKIVILVCGFVVALVALVASGQQPVPPAATPDEIIAGEDRYKYLTAWAAAQAGLGAGGGISGSAAATIAYTNAQYFFTNGAPAFYVRSYGAVPNDAVSDTVPFQNALDAAGVAGGGVVIADAGTYLFDPDELVYPSRTSEGHPAVINLWSNNVWLVGAGMNATTFKLTKDYGGGVVNFLGSGCSLGAGSPPDAYTLGTTNIVIAGFTLDANGFSAECTQVYNPSNWLVMDVRARNAGLISGVNYDAFDFQGESFVFFKDIEAADCVGNGFGVTASGGGKVIADGVRIIRCGLYGGFGGAIQCTATPPPKIRNLQVIDCATVLSTSSHLNVVNGYFWLTNTLTTATNFDLTSGINVFLTDCKFETPTTGGGQMFWVRGGGLYLDNVEFNNYQSGILMASGETEIRRSKIGGNGTARPVVTTGGTIRILDSEISGASSQRDIRLQTGTTAALIRNSRFLGTSDGPWLQFSGFTLENCIVAAPLRVEGTGTLIGNTLNSLTNQSGNSLYLDNTISGQYQREAGTPVFLGNVFVGMNDTTRNELQESLPTRTAITPTATQTLWTNNTPYSVEVHWFGGTATGFGRNGQQHGTGAGSLTLQPGSWVGITNSGTPEIYYSATR